MQIYESPLLIKFGCSTEDGVMMSALKNDNTNIYIGIGNSDEEFA